MLVFNDEAGATARRLQAGELNAIGEEHSHGDALWTGSDVAVLCGFPGLPDDASYITGQPVTYGRWNVHSLTCGSISATFAASWRFFNYVPFLMLARADLRTCRHMRAASRP